MNHLNVAVPVGIPSEPVTVAWSCTVVPAGTIVTTWCDALWMSVAVLDVSFVTVNGSHAPVEPLYVLSPEYVAWNEKLPDTFGVCANDVPSATPEPSSVNADDVSAAAPLHVPFVNHLNVTVPVGVCNEPVTVAWSCTVVPAGTDVTTGATRCGCRSPCSR